MNERGLEARCIICLQFEITCYDTTLQVCLKFQSLLRPHLLAEPSGRCLRNIPY